MSIAEAYNIGAYLAEPMIGEDISEVAERAVSLANTKRVTTFFVFNSWLIVVGSNATIDEICASYEEKTSTSNVKVYFVKGMIPFEDLTWRSFFDAAEKAVWYSGMLQGTVCFTHMNKLVVVGLGSTVSEVCNL